MRQSGGRSSSLGKENLTYDPKEDVYVCPAGRLLQPLGRKKDEGEARERTFTSYRAKASSCKMCVLRARCTSNKLGRNLTLSPFEGYLDRPRNYAGTHSYEKAL